MVIGERGSREWTCLSASGSLTSDTRRCRGQCRWLLVANYDDVLNRVQELSGE